jgi:tRNA(Arg) A34 adenosine deaminase TadA
MPPKHGAAAAVGRQLQQQQASCPFRHDDLFEKLFEPRVFPHFFRVFEECDIDFPSATISSGSASDSTTSICITDEGFKKMAECYFVRNRGADEILGPSQERASEIYSFKNLSKFLAANKEKKAADSPPDEVQAQAEYAERLMTLVLSLPLSEKHRKENDTCWGVMDGVPLTASKPDRADPFFSFCLWLLNHCTIPHQSTGPTSPKPNPHKCRAEDIVKEFLSAPDDRQKFEHMVTLVRFCHLLRFWHRDSFTSKSQCIFELCYCSSDISMFNLCSEKEAARALQDCMKLIHLDYLQPEARVPSPLTSRWILLAAGRSVKQWGHHSSYEFEQCEVEKESNNCEKWRHLIYSYAVMSLLYNEFNGNKQGPIGNYDFRDKCKIGPVGIPQEDASSQKFVYASKATEDGTLSEASDYLGHNIVALAVCKRGSVLRVSYNHNVLFSSTVDHAEERLIDGLFKDPAAFIPKSHAEIFKSDQRVNIEAHMKHISVYTSLEPCQQCSGKLHIAEVPEVIFCQRDWVSM